MHSSTSRQDTGTNIYTDIGDGHLRIFTSEIGEWLVTTDELLYAD